MVSKASGVVPESAVTEPSPVTAPSQNAVSGARNNQSVPEDTGTVPVTSESDQISLEQDDATPGPSHKLSEESSESSDDQTAAPSEPEQDDLRNVDAGCWENYVMRFARFYAKIWKNMNTIYAIPFWLFLMIIPMAAGSMGALHMYDCPASRSLPQLIFTTSATTMIFCTLRVCLILSKLMTREIDDCKKMLHTFIGLTSILSVLSFVTESVTYWTLPPTDDMWGHRNYCEPGFLEFCFYWNCAMSVIIVPVFLFPA